MWWEDEAAQKGRIERRLRERKFGKPEEAAPKEPVAENPPVQPAPEPEPTVEPVPQVVVVDNSEAVLERMDKLLEVIAGQQQLLNKLVEKDTGYRVVNQPARAATTVEYKEPSVMPVLKGVDTAAIDTSGIEVGIGGAGKDVTEGASNKGKLANLRKLMKE